MNKAEQENLINNWILNQLTLCQKDYFFHFEKKAINLATARLIKFARVRLSNEYLELIKVSQWSENTKKTLLFVYQQLLLLLHSSIPYITEYIYQEITQQKILEGKIEMLPGTSQSDKLWQVDCLLLLISNIRQVQEKSNSNHFYLELIPKWKDRIDPNFDFNQFLLPLVKSNVSISAKPADYNSLVDLSPFGTLWYQQETSQEELQKQLRFYEKECQRSKGLLENSNFLTRAPPNLVKAEKSKLNYYEEQKKKLLGKIKLS